MTDYEFEIPKVKPTTSLKVAEQRVLDADRTVQWHRYYCKLHGEHERRNGLAGPRRCADGSLPCPEAEELIAIREAREDERYRLSCRKRDAAEKQKAKDDAKFREHYGLPQTQEPGR